ncbi:MAG: DDE-type integrase/transposase/recombinase [Sphingobacteriaceae bacterium]
MQSDQLLTFPELLSAHWRWSMDFMHDVLKSKRKFRTLNIIDDYNREALAIDAQYSITSKQMTNVLKQLLHEREKPEWIRVDNGPEFMTKYISLFVILFFYHCLPNEVLNNRINFFLPLAYAFGTSI